MTDLPAADAPEHVRARWWRENVVRLSRAALAEAIGYSPSIITDIERGANRGTGAPIDPAVMHRYRMACAALTVGASFDWTSCRLRPAVPVTIDFG